MSETPIELKQKAYQRFAEGDVAGALSMLVDLETLTGIHASLANDIAVAHYRLGQYPEAIDRFRQALSLQGESEHLVANNLIEIVSELVLKDAVTRVKDRMFAQGNFEEPDGAETWCPVCGAIDIGFSPLPDMYRQQAQRHGYTYFGQGEMTSLGTYTCRQCGASDRERLYAYWVKKSVAIGRIGSDSKVIHFAPEPAFSRWLSGLGFEHYETADMAMQDVDHRVDLMSLPFENNAYDFFVCSHVLEHVTDDQKAMRELSRITRKGGCGILMAPVISDLEETVEDPSITDTGERWRLFGQDDHVRLYGHKDYVSRIERNGFRVEQLGEEHFGERLFSQMGLKPSSILYIVEPA